MADRKRKRAKRRRTRATDETTKPMGRSPELERALRFMDDEVTRTEKPFFPFGPPIVDEDE